MTNKNYFKEKKIDNNIFVGDSNKNEIKYGLPQNVKYCKKCVISNQRPNSTVEFKNFKDKEKEPIKFTNGVCDACISIDQKNKINWADREKELISLCEAPESTGSKSDN